MSWLSELHRQITDALNSLKAAIAVIITGTGSGFGLFFEWLERGLALAGIAVSMTLGVVMIRKHILDIRITLRKEQERLEDRLRNIKAQEHDVNRHDCADSQK